jgi:hypothetical protein
MILNQRRLIEFSYIREVAMTERNIGLEILEGIWEIKAFWQSKEFPKIKSVKPLPDYRLRVVFYNDMVVTYDCSPLLEEAVFNPLSDQSLFNQAQVDSGGYGIVWNDDIDLSESELWLNGMKDSTSRNNQIS